VVTGYPSSGKSEWVDAVAVNMAMMHGWKFAVCSFENPPDEHAAKWAEKYLAKPFTEGPTPRMTEEELRRAIVWVDRHFVTIRHGDDSPTIDWVLDKARIAVMRYGIKGLILDPYNEFEHIRRDSQTETLYVSDMLSKVKRFAQGHGVHVWFIAHPSKPQKDKQNEEPSLYDISGSANWVNKADIGISVHRGWDSDGSRSSVAEVHVKKVRFRAVGQPGIAKLEFIPATGRYIEYG
jgi:twinkle protein